MWRHALCVGRTSIRRRPAPVRTTPPRRALAVKSAWAEQSDAAREWVTRNRFYYATFGGLTALAFTGGAAYTYIVTHPQSVERVIVANFTQAFSAALDFEQRKSAYYSLPDYNLPEYSFAALQRAAASASSQQEHTDVVSTYASMVIAAVKKADSSWLLTTKELMRAALLAEARAFPTLAERLAAIKGLLPASVERNTLVQGELAAFMATTGQWLDASLLDEHCPQEPAEPCELRTKQLVTAGQWALSLTAVLPFLAATPSFLLTLTPTCSFS